MKSKGCTARMMVRMNIGRTPATFSVTVGTKQEMIPV